MTDRTEDPIHLRHGRTRRAFLGAGALTVLGLAAPPLLRRAAAQTPKRGGTLVVAADVSPPGLDPHRGAPGLNPSVHRSTPNDRTPQTILGFACPID